MEDVARHSGKDAEGEPIPLHADLSMDACILSPGSSVDHDLVAKGDRKLYLHLVMNGRVPQVKGGSRLKVGDVELGEGDGAFVSGKGPDSLHIESVGDKKAEFLLFDMGPADA